MSDLKQSDRVREIVLNRYIRPALQAGKTHLSVSAKDVLRDAEATPEFPRGRTPLVCNVLRSTKLLKEAGVVIERVDGPPSGQSRSVVVHYRSPESAQGRVKRMETPEERALRLTEKIRGLLKEEIQAHGGAEGFIRWVRSDEEGA